MMMIVIIVVVVGLVSSILSLQSSATQGVSPSPHTSKYTIKAKPPSH